MVKSRSLVLVLVTLLSTFTALLVSAQPRQPGKPGLMMKVREFQQLLAEKRQQGIDTAEAEQLNLQSRQAAQNGDQRRALELLEEATRRLRQGSTSTTAPDSKATQTFQPPSQGRPPRPPQKFQGGSPSGSQANHPPKGRRPGLPDSGREQAAGTTHGTAPVFALPFAHHYNGPGGYYAPAAEVRALAEFFHKHQMPGTMFFDGIHIERLKQEDPSIFPLINTYKLALGYHGEETHGPYPVPSDLFAEVYTLREAQGFSGTWSQTTGQDWKTAVGLVRERYSHALPHRIDPQTHMIDRRTETPNHLPQTGGLKLVQETFGRDVSFIPSHGLESAPVGFAFRKMSTFSLDQPAVPIALHALRIFKVGQVADQVMAVAGKDVSIFWYMGRLTSKGDATGEAGWTPRTLEDLPRLDRTQPRLLLMGFSKFSEAGAAETVKGLNEFFAANPGSAWVSGETISSHFEGEKEYQPTLTELSQIAATLVRDWKNRPPDLVTTPGRVYSLSDAFEQLCRAYAQTGAPGRPAGQTLYGPVLEDPQATLSAAGTIDIPELSQAAKTLVTVWAAQEDRFVPARIRVGTRDLNPAEFLFSLADGYAQRAKGNSGQARLIPSSVFPPYADVLQSVFKPRATQPLCYTNGQLWTIKPALAKAQASQVSRPLTIPVSPSSTAKGIVRVVFSANMDSKGGCYREDPSGADLYVADLHLKDGTVKNLRRLTSAATGAEWFPSLSDDGKWVAYNRTVTEGERRQHRQEVHLASLETSADTLVMEDARFPCFAGSSRLCFSLQAQKKSQICIADLEKSANGEPTLKNIRVVADERHGLMKVEDPSVFPDSRRLAFHRKQSQNQGAGGAVINLDSTGFQEVTPSMGAGHAAVNPDGRTVTFSGSQDGCIKAVQEENGVWSAPRLLNISTDPTTFRSFDPRFDQVHSVAHTYHEWVSPNLLLVSSQGSDGRGHFSFSRLFLFHFATGLWGNPEIIDVSGAIERIKGCTGSDFCTADGIILSE